MAEPVEGKVGRNPSPKAVEPASTLVEPEAGPWSVLTSPKGWLARFSLEQRFTVVTVIVVVLAMATLGHWIEQRVRAGWTQVMADVAASYIEAIVSPIVQELEISSTLSDDARSRLQALVIDGTLGTQIRVVKIWATNGELLFSTAGPPGGQRLRRSDLAKLMAGEFLAPTRRHIDEASADGEYIEIYAPIYSRKSRNVIAIGEFYKRASTLDKEITSLKHAIWFLIANMSLAVALALYMLIRRTSGVIAKQRAALEANVARSAALARHNGILRGAADRARIRASITSEEYLSRIGADLHDGPIQMLSLIMLRLPPPGSSQAEVEELRRHLQPLVEQTLGELRSLSSGLVLPEIRELSPVATIEAAVTWHERHTGSGVQLSIGELPQEVPEAIRICAFRVVQEALMNGFKHAGGRGQSVAAAFEDGSLTLVVEDEGPSEPRSMPSGGTGLRGMRSRVHALRGTLAMSRSLTGGTRILVRLPVRPRSLSAAID